MLYPLSYGGDGSGSVAGAIPAPLTAARPGPWRVCDLTVRG